MMLDPKKDQHEPGKAAPASVAPAVESGGVPPMPVGVPVADPSSATELPDRANEAQPASAYRTILRCRTRRESD
jgi:hypothetical protein